MKNQYAGPCMLCRQTVAVNEGYFVRRNKRWRLVHPACASAESKASLPPRYRKPDKTEEKPD